MGELTWLNFRFISMYSNEFQKKVQHSCLLCLDFRGAVVLLFLSLGQISKNSTKIPLSRYCSIFWSILCWQNLLLVSLSIAADPRLWKFAFDIFLDRYAGYALWFFCDWSASLWAVEIRSGPFCFVLMRTSTFKFLPKITTGGISRKHSAAGIDD